MANFGIGVGAFTDGFARGVGIGNTINTLNENKAKKRAFTDAKADYERAISDDVLTQAGKANADGSAPAFDVEGAKKTAKQNMSFTDYMYGTALPKIIDTYVAQGDIQGAEALRAWGQDAKERKFTEGFGKALNAFAAGNGDGNYQPFAEQTVKLLNDGGYGVQATGYDLVKDGDGNTTGITFNLKDGEREYSHTFNSMEEAGNFIAGQGDPRTRVQLFMQQQADANKLKADVAKEQMKAQIGLGKDVALEDVRQQGRINLENTRHSNNMQRDAAKKDNDTLKAERGADILRQYGYDEETIGGWMPSLLGIRDEERQRMSSDDVAKFAFDTLSKTDFEFARLPQADKQKKVQDFVQAFMAMSDNVAASRKKQPSSQPGIGAQQPPLNVFR